MSDERERFYLVRSDVLPEAMRKTIEVKELLERDRTQTIYKAVKQKELSRSAFYKYKDAVYPFRAVVKDKIMTIFIHLEDHPGTLSHLLKVISEYGSNVLTIHQTIPIQGRANVTLSLDIAGIKTKVDDLIKDLKRIEFVKQVDILSSGI